MLTAWGCCHGPSPSWPGGSIIRAIASGRVSPYASPRNGLGTDRARGNQATSGWRLGFACNYASQPGLDGTDNFLWAGNSTWRGGADHPVGEHRDAREKLAISLDRGADDEGTGPPGTPRIFKHLPIIGQRASLRCVRCDQRMHELNHCRGRGKVQLTAEHSLVLLVMLHRSSPVALGEVDADDDPVG
jgi:hypothetical protein